VRSSASKKVLPLVTTPGASSAHGTWSGSSARTIDQGRAKYWNTRRRWSSSAFVQKLKRGEGVGYIGVVVENWNGIMAIFKRNVPFI